MIKISKLPQSVKGIFIDRPNRFLAHIKLEQSQEIVEVHVHDPGRLKELLYPGNHVLISKAKNKNRKTKWDLLCAKKDTEWIFVNSSFHRRFSEVILDRSLIPEITPINKLRAEVRVPYGRLDFMGHIKNTKIWIETKGCTLIKNKIALFPDAPTKRGKKHLTSLISLKDKTVRSAVLILIFSKEVNYFSPNWETDPEFSKEFYRAMDTGVEIFPVSLYCDGESVYYNKIIPILRG
ncbi:DNA/RNA nuclease SfsA [Desulfothermus okinawensis JCM 13304]